MPRNVRVDVGNEIYHVINRANGRYRIFNTKEDYLVFERLLTETKELIDMRILAYTVMPNHWHMVLWPKRDGDLGRFMHRLTNAHTRKVHALTNTNGTGHLYQGRYKSFLIDADNYFLAVIRYVERNSVRAKLLRRCEDWQWGSAHRRLRGTKEEKKLLDLSPTPLPRGYRDWINRPDSTEDIGFIRTSIVKGAPYGRGDWVDKMVVKHNLESTLRSPGRSKKQ